MSTTGLVADRLQREAVKQACVRVNDLLGGDDE